MAILARRLTLADMGFTSGHLSVLRFVVGAALCLPLFWIRPALMRPTNLPALLTRGISGGIVVALYFYALAHIPAGRAGLLYNVFPVLAVVFSLVLLRERPRWHLFLAVLVASLGVLLVLGQGDFRVALGRGEMAAFAAAFFAATSANAIRKARSTDSSWTIFFFFCVAGLPVVLPFALTPLPGGLLPWALAVLMSLLAFAGQILMADAYGALAVSEAAGWLQLMPIVQYALGVLLLGEHLSAWGLAGAALTVSGVAYGTVFGRRGKDT
ncbi:MAG: DMT family transporter [Acidobacteria bacterium]|nr:DMT family transporter [Acidobacteriota bacterium]